LIKRVLGWTGLVALAAVLVLAGYWLLFTVFMGYDDEGYVLISLRNYGAHGALYDQVFSQYGPFFFAAYDAVHRVLGFAWTNSSGRLLTLALWSATALFPAALVWRRTRSTGATALTLAGVFAYLWVMVHEPSHPGGCVGLLVALAAWTGAEADPARRPWAAAAIGAIGAALALTKINVGAFMFTSAVAWLVVHAAAPRVRQIGGWLVAAWFVLLPWVLMRPMLGQDWIWEFAMVSTLASVGALVAAWSEPPAGASWREAGAFVGGAAVVTLLTIAVTLARGTTWHGLWAGVVLDPLNHPFVYNFAFPWRPGTLAVAAASLAIVLAAWRRPDSRWIAGVVVTVRFLAMAALVLSALVGAQGLGEGAWHLPDLAKRALSALGWDPISLAAFGMSFGVGLAAICALPLRRDAAGRDDARVRQWLALVLVLQFLHAYPVAGSQLNWGTFLWVPLLILAVRDAWLSLPSRAWYRPLTVTAAVGAFGLSGIVGYTLLKIGLENRKYGEALGLPGAERIIVPDDTVFALRIMAENARAHADMLFSLSGLYSFNLWTGLPTPTLANATQWFESLSPDRQQAIISRLQADPRAALIIQLDTLGYLVENGFRVRGALANYLAHEFCPAFKVDGYAFWVHRGRRVAALSTGRITPRADSSGASRLELVLAAPSSPITRIEVWEVGGTARHHLLTLSAANSALDVTPLDASGQATGQTAPGAWSAALPSGIIRAGVDFHVAAAWPEEVVAFVFDSAGRRLAAARVLR
jgi:hypothetical protein